MKYKNAQDILPDELIQELQQYLSGGVLYIPKAEGKKPWGEKSGARQYYKQRNEEIRSAYRCGTSMEELSQRYGLTVEAIRKIIY